jgi:hypothetical protein
MPTIDLPDDELAAVTAAIRRLIRGRQVPPRPAAGSAARGSGEARRGVGPRANSGPEGPAASQSRQAGAAITGDPRGPGESYSNVILRLAGER